MKALTIRFIGAWDPVSLLIQWTTNSLWCHTEALSRDGTQWIGAHARTGVQARKLNWCKTKIEAVYGVPVSDAGYEKAMTWLEDREGMRYNYIAILGLSLHARVGVNSSRQICSALMLEFMMQAGLFPLNCLEAYSYLVTPEMLHLSPVFIGHRLTV